MVKKYKLSHDKNEMKYIDLKNTDYTKQQPYSLNIISH